MAAQDFSDQLRDIGYDPSVEENRVIFDYTVEVGKFKGQKVKLGFEAQDFPLAPPSGPHLSPRILPLNPSAECHPEKVVESPFGEDWEYWSRPYPATPGWQKSSRSARAYLRHIRHLWLTQ